MVHIATQDAEIISVPFWVTDIHKFREWVHSEDFPDLRRIWWLVGQVWVDITMEQVFTHVDVKSEFGAVLRVLSKKKDLGRYLADGVLLTNVEAGFSGIPDGMFVAHESLAADRVRFVESH